MVSLVTGGCGFIGSHMVDRLLMEGHTVRVIDNWTTGRAENLDHQKDNPNLDVYHMDIRNKEEIEPIFDGVDYVFHFAALADIVPSIQKPWEYYSSNVIGTFHVVECAKNAGIKKLVYAASSSCYGIPDEYPVNNFMSCHRFNLTCCRKITHFPVTQSIVYTTIYFQSTAALRTAFSMFLSYIV